MNAYIKVTLILLTLNGTTADFTKLMERLYSKTWPWYGDRYTARCPYFQENWPRCFNPRHEVRSDVLNRIFIHHAQPTIEIEVIFSAPTEPADVCGKSVSLKEVKPFKLNTDGFPIVDLLKRGAEIYRRMPIVKWDHDLHNEHSLLFIDTGLIKVRGYFGNVSSNGTHLLGEVLWPYTPPANPLPYRNPIVILLLQEIITDSVIHQKKLFNSECMIRGVSETKLRGCTSYLSTLMSAANVKAVQVYYTDGSSLYEKSRACQEGTFCHEDCIKKYKSYVIQKAPSIKFMKVDPAKINMYVNVVIRITRRFNYTACCKNVIVDPYVFRAVPGDNHMAESIAKLMQEHQLEISGSGSDALDANTYYSVLMVDSNGPPPNTELLPYGKLWIANLGYQDHHSAGTEFEPYAAPTPQDEIGHTYYIMLFSHQNLIKEMPEAFYKKCPYDEKKRTAPEHLGPRSVERHERAPNRAGRCNWDFSKLPADLHLRGITWFRAQKDNYIRTLQGVECVTHSLEEDVTTPDPSIIEGPCFPPPIVFDKIPKLAIKLTHQGDLLESVNPSNPDFDYDEPPSAGNFLDIGGTLWLIIFCLRVQVEFHI